MPYTSGPNATDLQEVTTRNHTARQVIGGFSRAFPTLAEAWQLIDSALADTPGLTAEIIHLRTRLTDTRRDRANLLAAARATISAAHDHETDPLSYLRDELQARGQLPPEPWRPA